MGRRIFIASRLKLPTKSNHSLNWAAGSWPSMPRGQKIGNRRLRMPWLFSPGLLTGSSFANDILCLFVRPPAEEHGLTELASLVHSVNLTWATSTGSAHSQRFMTAGVTPWPQRPGLLSGGLPRPPATGTPSCSECPCFFPPVGGLWRICNSSRDCIRY